MADKKVSTKLLKGIYAANVPFAGISGLIMLFAPEKMVPEGFDPLTTGIAGSITLSFAILSVFGFRAPLKFLPVLLIQLMYKSLWFVIVTIPLFIEGTFPSDSIPMVVIFAVYIGVLTYAIPIRTLLTETDTE